MDGFARALLAWFDRHGRHDLPWQHPRDAYRVWLSEVMLQQTQVRTVIGYFQRFVAALPDLGALAAAPLDQVLALWSGLGYYSRARNLHRCARLCIEHHGGELPRDLAALSALPGIGRSTAAAILAQVHGDRHAILDGNVRRVLARVHGVHGWPGASTVQKRLWELADTHTPATRTADYTQAIMDFGATVCTRARPRCTECPLSNDCAALREGEVARLPTPKPGRAIPERATTMLIVHDEAGRVLLERRPPTGVWASLWSLPECSAETDIEHELARRNTRPRGERHRLPELLHVFSHYRLRITPLRLQATPAPGHIADGDILRWSTPAELASLGLPAPVRKLLGML
ncbi:MAG TPA: A/G-specific adenine glycosylase [Dokdonella sp.]|uniref:A/G-specific adenine glycosylase n=1 Tax=Dokdonella sp. TaxID=2291710 RepID=UPI0025C4EBC2|nr:A/G-specific adenine glycosylase [Dokdonella sp.]MBX3691924.1 A/G-specific adenine glycosylase [Dokdonella sp.]MCW5568166.1 A/G-specific adenine glycosylase [Dokdonella sp.]HNR92845.1 A/G-specific adenine glycosylase [Dokdonella sp.]